ncbi:MAG: hypothetical protein AAB692_02920 [Patescibacteria group bacterium]
MNDPADYHLKSLSPAMQRRSMFLALELAACLAAFGLAGATNDHESAIIVALMCTLVFAIFYAAMALARSGANDPAISFSIVTRLSLVPAFLPALAAASPAVPLSIALGYAFFSYWLVIAAVQEVVRHEESDLAAEASRSLLTLQMVLFAFSLAINNVWTTVSVVFGALLAAIALRLHAQRQSDEPAHAVTRARPERAEEQDIQ